MSFYYNNTTNLVKLLLILSFLAFFNHSCSVFDKLKNKRASKNNVELTDTTKLVKSTKKKWWKRKKKNTEEIGDPITESIKNEMQKQEQIGIKLTDKDYRKLGRIYKKYSLSDKEKDLRKRESGGYNSSKDEVIEHNRQSSGYIPKTIVKKEKKTSEPPKTSKKKRKLIERFLLSRSYRKDYLRNEKLEEFRKERILSIQSPTARARMEEREKQLKKREKYNKRKKRREYIKNLFR